MMVATKKLGRKKNIMSAHQVETRKWWTTTSN
jgi:hypothetical protein